MRHQKHKYNVGSSPSHRISLMKNLSISLIEHGKIKSTQAKCKALRPFIEKLVTLAKVDSIANRRLAYSKLNSDEAVKKLFTEIGPKFKATPGGYTRIVKVADGRVGDNAKMGYIGFV